MRWLLGSVLLAGVAWGGYWFVGARTLDTQIEAAFARAEAEGRDIGKQAVSIQGFPNRFDVTVTGPHAAQDGWSWSAPFVQVFSMTWKPWHLIAILPPEQDITMPDGTQLALTGVNLRGSLQLHPGLDLALNEAVLEGQSLSLGSGAGVLGSLDRLVLAAGEDPSWKNGLRLGLQATNLTPDPDWLAPVTAATDLGPVIAESHADMTLQLSAPVDRHLGPDTHVQAVHLNEAHVAWGKTVVSAKGELTRDDQGRAEGKISVSVQHWQPIVPALQALKLIPETYVPMASRALTALAQAGGDPDRIALDLVLQDGQMRFGAIPLGPAPRLP